MGVINFEDNFATNQSGNTSAGATSTGLNAVPSVAAPFWLALDATGLNSKFEIVYVTSKTSNSVSHAATTYDHTTAEEVRLVTPATFLKTLTSVPQGFLFNGKISPTVASNNLTVAIKTMAGNDPSVTDPVWVRIGDTMRAITSALSVTKNAGTNWFNAGSSELATKEIDYFAYLGYNATDGVVIGFSRIPYGTQYGDFNTTSTNEKYAAISTITNAASGDYYENVGRFAATLSAGAGYTWSVPAYTALNLIQRPIYTTRVLSAVASGGGFSAKTNDVVNYVINGRQMSVEFNVSGTSNSAAGTWVLPMATAWTQEAILPFRVADNGSVAVGRLSITASSSAVTMGPSIGSTTFTASGTKVFGPGFITVAI